MHLIQGHTFNVVKPMLNFKVGSMYRIYRIAALKEGVRYIFYSKDGNLEVDFASTAEAEAVISKMSGVPLQKPVVKSRGVL